MYAKKPIIRIFIVTRKPIERSLSRFRFWISLFLNFCIFVIGNELFSTFPYCSYQFSVALCSSFVAEGHRCPDRRRKPAQNSNLQNKTDNRRKYFASKKKG